MYGRRSLWEGRQGAVIIEFMRKKRIFLTGIILSTLLWLIQDKSLNLRQKADTVLSRSLLSIEDCQYSVIDFWSFEDGSYVR